MLYDSFGRKLTKPHLFGFAQTPAAEPRGGYVIDAPVLPPEEPENEDEEEDGLVIECRDEQ